MNRGPPGEVKSCTEHGLLKDPGTDFLYSFANPAVLGGLLTERTNVSVASYLDLFVFPLLGIKRSQWRWLGDKEGNSQPDGGSFHTASNFAKLVSAL